ncbi:type I-C CRISPR-associated endonuclease Cas1c [Scatolibacter rhodanostii]|uniref:type I-C CRISPR-associated endonuclease Cas1c n=1 Tax=Scatolibacter rhodanostii TaxID=2014781 RepID=UPI000C074D73|nr:type I-C CRISPR-associated endonuclease Cas1c [Scatolibacter rhodanostii]
MRKLLNTLFVTTPDAYLSLDGENVIVQQEKKELARFPLHTLENIVTFTYPGASPSLMGACAKHNINLCLCTPNGRFLARAVGKSNGNVLLRRTQYRIADDVSASSRIARNMIFGKVYNARWSVERTIRDHGMRIDKEKLQNASGILQDMLPKIQNVDTLESLRGLEGETAATYFSVLDEMILNDKENFYFPGRSRRPPLDKMNAMLSFVYSLLANDCAAALESVGLDSYVGFMHRDRPGRSSLALDLMEELRACFADRFVLTLINNRIIKAKDFQDRESGATLMTDEGRKTVIKAWQERKRETITHPYLKEKIPWGLVPYVQSLLLARYLRDDLDGYPPFLWK